MKCDTDLQENRRIRKIIQQLQTVGWDKVKHIDKNFRTLELNYRDENTEKVSIILFVFIQEIIREKIFEMTAK